MSKGPTFVFEVDPHELALRIGEAAIQVVRKPGMPPAEVLAEMRLVNAFMVDGFYRAAQAAAEYLASVIATQQDGAKVQ